MRPSLPAGSRSSLMQFAIVCLVAFAVFLLFRAHGIANDCTPQQIDGQCGMSTFFNEIIGAIAAIVVILLGGGVVLTNAERRRKQAAEPRIARTAESTTGAAS